MADHYRVKIKGTNQVYNFKNGESMDQIRTVVGIENIKQRLNREMSHAPGPEITTLMTTLDQYVGDVMSGKIAMDGINRINDIGVRMTQGDPRAAMQMVEEFAGIGMIGGRFAKMANLDALDEAKKLLDAGGTRDDVFGATGWWKGVDDKWKFEIDDSGAVFDSRRVDRLQVDNAKNRVDITKYERDEAIKTLKPLMDGADDTQKVAIRNQMTGFEKEYRSAIKGYGDAKAGIDNIQPTIGDAMKHDELFDSYSDARNLSLRAENDVWQDSGSFDNANNRINLNTGYEQTSQKSTTLHELQHSVQSKEGFARGGSPEMFEAPSRDVANGKWARIIQSSADDNGSIDVVLKELKGEVMGRHYTDNTYDADDLAVVMDLINSNNPKKLVSEWLKKSKLPTLTPMDQYTRLAGEAEARAVQKRMDMTPAERKARPFWKDLDIPEDDQIVRF